MPDHRLASIALYPQLALFQTFLFTSYESTGMDVNEFSIRGDVDCRKPRLVHTSESSNHNGHVSTINLSYQVIFNSLAVMLGFIVTNQIIFCLDCFTRPQLWSPSTLTQQ